MKMWMRNLAAMALATGFIPLAAGRAGAQVTTTNRVLDLDANAAGGNPAVTWVPDAGVVTGGGTLSSTSGTVPSYTSAANSYYTFTTNSTQTTANNGSVVTGNYIGGYTHTNAASGLGLYFGPTSPFSLEAWVRPGTMGQIGNSGSGTLQAFGTMIGDEGFPGGPVTGYMLYLDSVAGSTVATSYNVGFIPVRGANSTNGTGNISVSTTGSPIQQHQWVQIVGTYDGAGVMSIYINGVLSITNTVTAASIPATNDPGTNIFNIGMRDPTSSGQGQSNSLYFGGDEAIDRVYSAALTPTQVQNNYNAEATRFGLPQVTPEPSAAALALLVGGMGMLRRRRRAV